MITRSILLILGINLFLNIFATMLHVGADDLFHQKVYDSEKRLGLFVNPDTPQEAMIQRDLEVCRYDYARAMKLIFEGIESEMRFEHARAEYEKQVIKLASGNISTPELLRRLAVQRKVLDAWRKSKINEAKLD